MIIWEAALRVLRYLKGCLGQGIVLRNDSILQLYAFCDSDWAACPITMHSLTVILCFLVLHMSLGRQRNNLLWFGHQLRRSINQWLLLHVSLSGWNLFFVFLGSTMTSLCIFCDSQVAMHLAANPIFMNRLNISKLTVILCIMSCNMEILQLAMFGLLTN